jgi:hypothetical protein
MCRKQTVVVSCSSMKAVLPTQRLITGDCDSLSAAEVQQSRVQVRMPPGTLVHQANSN